VGTVVQTFVSSDSEVASVAQFVRRVNWKVNWKVNWRVNSPIVRDPIVTNPIVHHPIVCESDSYVVHRS
jgi:hypothetical protein